MSKCSDDREHHPTTDSILAVGAWEGEAVGAFTLTLVAFEKMEALSIGSLVVQLRRAQIEDWRWWRSKRTPPTRARNLR